MAAAEAMRDWSRRFGRTVAGGGVAGIVFLFLLDKAIDDVPALLLYPGLVFSGLAVVLGWAIPRLERSRPEPEAPPPNLSFGRPEIPPRSVPIDLRVGDGDSRRFMGRVIRVPVVNAPGAGDARKIHARLLFLPDELHRSERLAPRDAAQGEWSDRGDVETEIDLAGNGHPRLLDVVIVLDGAYPHAFEWTRRSRAAGLNGYAIMSNPVTVKVEVFGRDRPTPFLVEDLEIECRPKSMLRADWLGSSRKRDEGTNWVAWDYR